MPWKVLAPCLFFWQGLPPILGQTRSNNEFLNEHYPKVIRALDFIIKNWDPDKNGVLEGAKHNTLDSRLGGNSAWHGSLYAAATMIEAGMMKEGLTIVKAVSDRYRGNLKVGYDGAWSNFGYSGNPFGDDECGKFYSRAMSIWSVLLGLHLVTMALKNR